jgi:hypothetical protein
VKPQPGERFALTLAEAVLAAAITGSNVKNRKHPAMSRVMDSF